MYTRLVLSERSPWWSLSLVLPGGGLRGVRKVRKGGEREVVRTFVLIGVEMVETAGVEAG